MGSAKHTFGGGVRKLTLSLVAALALVLGLCPAVALAGEVEVEPEGTVEPVAVVQGEELAVQVDGVPYIDADGTTKTADGVQALASSGAAATWGGEGNGQFWYVAGDGTSTTGIQFTERVTVRGDVCLILADNATLTASKGITVTGAGNSLTIYTQSKEGDGVSKLEATGSDWDAGIGSGDGGADGATSGTTGKSRRVEAVRVRLTGEAKDAYDVYYRVHGSENAGRMLGWGQRSSPMPSM